MSGICDGRVAIVTGGGRGIGHAHALALASEGARVVVNDLDVAVDGSKSQGSSAAEVVEQIRDAGGHATVNTDDVASWPGAERLVRSAIDSFGRLDSLVCNAGNLLDRPLVDMSEHDWETVVSVHLNGHAAPLHHAARHWHSIAERTGEPSGGRAVLTTSGAGLWGDPWRTNYSSAKAGIAMLGRTAAAELTAYGVSVNVIAPFARTRMTVQLDPELEQLPPPGEFDPFDAANISPLVVFRSCGRRNRRGLRGPRRPHRARHAATARFSGRRRAPPGTLRARCRSRAPLNSHIRARPSVDGSEKLTHRSGLGAQQSAGSGHTRLALRSRARRA